MTKLQMQQRIKVIADQLGCTTSKEEAMIKDHKSYLYIDMANGGYMLVFRQVATGGEMNFYDSSRMSNKEFNVYTQGVIGALSVANRYNSKAF